MRTVCLLGILHGRGRSINRHDTHSCRRKPLPRRNMRAPIRRGATFAQAEGRNWRSTWRHGSLHASSRSADALLWVNAITSADRHEIQLRHRAVRGCTACDGRAVRSCSIPAGTAIGKPVVTIEGVSPDGAHPIQLAWKEFDTPQCGYCQSGMIMSALALLRERPHPTDADIDARVTNACRCGTYYRIRKAIHLAADLMGK